MTSVWACAEHLRSKAFPFVLELVRHITSKSLPCTLYSIDMRFWSVEDAAFDCHWGKEDPNTFLQHFSHAQISMLRGEWMTFLEKMRPTAEAYAGWKNMQATATIEKCISRWKRYVRSVYGGVLREIVKRISKLDHLERVLDGDVTSSQSSGKPIRRKRLQLMKPVKRCRFRTVEEVEVVKKNIEKKRNEHAAFRRQVFGEYVDLVTSAKWDFTKEVPTTQEEEIKQRCNDARHSVRQRFFEPHRKRNITYITAVCLQAVIG
jgi:hypothetical protein